MVDARELYKKLRTKLQAMGKDNAAERAVLFSLAVGMGYPEAAVLGALPDVAEERLDRLIERRRAGEPLQYMAGSWPFLDFELTVGEGVLIPRPDTEALAETAIDFLSEREKPTALDLCSGSGCVAIAIKRARPEAETFAVELSCDAFVYLEKNISRLAPEITAVNDDVFEYYKSVEDASLDLITCNPPYVAPDEYENNIDELKFEPRMAFVSDDPYYFYKRIIKDYRGKLKSRGVLMFEVGAGMSGGTEGLFRESGYTDVRTVKDMFGADRVVVGVKG